MKQIIPLQNALNICFVCTGSGAADRSAIRCWRKRSCWERSKRLLCILIMLNICAFVMHPGWVTSCRNSSIWPLYFVVSFLIYSWRRPLRGTKEERMTERKWLWNIRKMWGNGWKTTSSWCPQCSPPGLLFKQLRQSKTLFIIIVLCSLVDIALLHMCVHVKMYCIHVNKLLNNADFSRYGLLLPNLSKNVT